MSTDRIVIDEPQENMTLEEEAASKGLDANGDPVDAPSGDDSESERPQWLPEKFKSPEDMAKAYSELEAKLGSKDRTEKEQQEIDEGAKEAVENAGLDFDAMSEEYYANDGLSDTTYQQLEKAGIPREIVDQYIEGQRYAGEVAKNELIAGAGGEEQYNEMTEWASDNFSEDEIDAFNEAINGPQNMARMAIAGLKARYEAAQGTEPRRTLGGNEPRDGTVYRSVAELMEDMKNPKYESDEAFRSDVERKLARSNIM